VGIEPLIYDFENRTIIPIKKITSLFIIKTPYIYNTPAPIEDAHSEDIIKLNITKESDKKPKGCL
jgi:hypothetical protein